MGQAFCRTCRVEWHDTDAAGIAHYTSFFRYMEETEHAFLRSLGFSVLSDDATGRHSWPRVSVSCDYSGAVKFEDEVELELTLDRLGEKSASYRFRMTHAGRTVAEGRSVAVYCRLSDDGPPRSTPIPSPLADKLRPYLSEA